jgi:tetratricopeptide (TPR) repeat protein
MNKNPDFDTLMRAGVEFGRQDRHKDALACFDRALSINPKDNQAWANKGHALQGLSRDSEAKTCYKRALELNPTDAHALFAKGLLHERLGELEEAAACYGKMLEMNPKNDGIWFKKGQVLLNSGNTEEALEAFRRFISVASPGNAAAVNHVKRMIADLEKAHEPDRRIDLNRDADQSDSINGIITLLKEAVPPKDVELHVRLMRAYLERGKSADSVSAFAAVVEQYPKWPQFHYDLLSRVTKLGHDATLRAAFEEALRNAPGNHILHYGYGIVQQTRRNHSAAKAEFQKAIEIAPSFAPAYLNLGISFAATGEADKALDWCEQAKDKDNTMAEAHFMLGKLYQSINPIRAVVHFDLFNDFAYPYLARSQYAAYARMHVEHGKQMLEEALPSSSGNQGGKQKNKEICPRCGKEVERLSGLRDTNHFEYFFCDLCCKEIGGTPL